ncbi:MAG: metallophosphoesterase [Alphaproteobacteria bacterium]
MPPPLCRPEAVATPANGAAAWARRGWATARAAMEQGSGSDFLDEARIEWLWKPLRTVVRSVDWGRLLRGIYWRGVRNALDVRLERLDFAFESLPAAFDGYTILHITDPHFDKLEETAGRIIALIEGLEADACALTGDYGDMRPGQAERVLAPLGDVVSAVTARDGVFAVLGNHDSMKLVEPFERLGVRVLVNETVGLERAGARIHVTGLDDVHYFYTDDAREALFSAPDGFRIALVHSPEIADVAAAAGVDFYLAGHTHGGQVCLPGGRPIVTNLRRNRAFAAGLWRCGDMVGYTSAGAGVSILPVRFNTRGEVTLITLRRA